MDITASPDDGISDIQRDMLIRMGVAVVGIWGELPRDIQRVVFEAAVGSGNPADADIRERIARFLHDNGHQHTS